MKILGIETSCDETGASIVEDGVQIISNSLASSVEIQKKWGGVVPERAAREQIKCIVPMVQETMQNQEYGVKDILRATPYRTVRGSREVISRVSSRLRSNNKQSLLFSTSSNNKQSLLFSTSSNNKQSLLFSTSSNNNYQIDAIAVTVGPGLIGSLLVGVETAKTLAYVWNKPIVPVNHLIGHIYGCWLNPTSVTKNLELRTENKNSDRSINSPNFPAVVLLVSGGHTELILMGGHGKFKLLGTTRDDAAGEAFDKTARLLGLGYPGGPAIAAAAAKWSDYSSSDPPAGGESRSRFWTGQNDKINISSRLRSNNKIILPRPMIGEKNFDFSFSGLKTAALREIEKYSKEYCSSPARQGENCKNFSLRSKNNLTEKFILSMANEIQEAITDVLVEKTIRAVEEYSPASLLVCGGVAANTRLREKFEKEMTNYQDTKLFFPPVEYCTDNAATIASAAFFNYSPIPWQKVDANPSLGITDSL